MDAVSLALSSTESSYFGISVDPDLPPVEKEICREMKFKDHFSSSDAVTNPQPLTRI